MADLCIHFKAGLKDVVLHFLLLMKHIGVTIVSLITGTYRAGGHTGSKLFITWDRDDQEYDLVYMRIMLSEDIDRWTEYIIDIWTREGSYILCTCWRLRHLPLFTMMYC